MIKKLVALIMLTTMALGTVVNAQDITGEGTGAVPVDYQSKSTFTVVLPDSISLDSTKTQEFEIYLREYDLIDGDKVRVKPISNTITMTNNPKLIEYLVSDEATSFEGLPEFPSSRVVQTSQGKQTETYYDYILTKTSGGNFRVYCSTLSSGTEFTVKRDELDGTYEIKTNKGELKLYKYNKETNTWEVNNVSNNAIPQSETIIQSTLPIMDGESEYMQYSKELKDDVKIPILMQSEYLTDETPIKGTINGSDLSSGNWNGELMFEITLVN